MSKAFLTGARSYLRALSEADIQGPYVQWLNDPEVCRGNSHHAHPYTEGRALSYVQHANTTETALILAIVLKEDNLHIGNISLQKIDWTYRTADFAILLGDKRFWGKGYGLEAARLILTHGFHQLNLNRIACATFETNQGMQKLALSLGMKQEGIRRNAAYKDNSYINIVEFGLLREDFKITG